MTRKADAARRDLALQIELAAMRQQAQTGLTLTEHQRMHIANRVMLQGPGDLSEVERAKFLASMNRRFNELPGDVMFTLNAIRLLAEQGNRVAIKLFDDECTRLGITRTKMFLT